MFSQGIRRFVNPATAISIIVLAVASAMLATVIVRTAQSWRWVIHTREVLEQVNGTFSLVNQADALQKSLRLAYDAQDAARLRAMLGEIPRQERALARMTIDNPVQQQTLADFRRLSDGYVRSLQAGLERRSAYPGRDQERAMREQIAAQVAALRAEEQRLLLLREASVRRDRAWTVAAAAAISVLPIVLLLIRSTARREAADLIAERTNLKRAQLELSAANRMLEQRVQERTAQLAEANIELRAFAHTIAHDLRAPLRNIEGYATAVLEDEAPALSESGAGFLKRMGAVIQRMDRLITDLLAYSQLSRAELRLTAVELDRVVQLALQDLGAQIAASGARVEVGAPLPVVLGTEALLVQVFDNLIGNAIKFVRRGAQPDIRIAARVDGRQALVWASDQGIGIPADKRDRVFDVFERLHGEEEYPGTGIGLAIVRKGVERLGGSIGVEPAPVGTTFRLDLPLPAPRERQ